MTKIIMSPFSSLSWMISCLDHFAQRIFFFSNQRSLLVVSHAEIIRIWHILYVGFCQYANVYFYVSGKQASNEKLKEPYQTVTIAIMNVTNTKIYGQRHHNKGKYRNFCT